jgi:hypothetical protein
MPGGEELFELNSLSTVLAGTETFEVTFPNRGGRYRLETLTRASCRETALYVGATGTPR